MAKLEKGFTVVLKPEPPYDFKLSLQKPAGWNLFTPFEVYNDGVLWTALHIGRELVGVKAVSLGSASRPKIRLEAYLRKKADAARKAIITNALIYKLGINEDLSEFYKIAKSDRILKHTLPDLYGMHDTGTSHLFAEAVLAICLQMAPMKRSEEMMECLIKNYGERADFDGKKIYVWPTAYAISRRSAQELARRCKLGYRAKNIVKLAKRIARGFPSIEELEKFSAEEAKKKLLELPGIGDYSSDIINPHGGFPIDVWSAEVFGKLFYGRPVKGRALIERIKRHGIKRWGKWSWMAFFYVVQDLENLSRKLKTKLRLS